jgi:hypothetical protein
MTGELDRSGFAGGFLYEVITLASLIVLFDS